MDELVQNQA